MGETYSGLREGAEIMGALIKYLHIIKALDEENIKLKAENEKLKKMVARYVHIAIEEQMAAHLYLALK